MSRPDRWFRAARLIRDKTTGDTSSRSLWVVRFMSRRAPRFARSCAAAPVEVFRMALRTGRASRSEEPHSAQISRSDTNSSDTPPGVRVPPVRADRSSSRAVARFQTGWPSRRNVVRERHFVIDAPTPAAAVVAAPPRELVSRSAW